MLVFLLNASLEVPNSLIEPILNQGSILGGINVRWMRLLNSEIVLNKLLVGSFTQVYVNKS